MAARAPLLLVVALSNPSVSDTHEVLLDTDFESDPLLEGWNSTTPLHPEGNLWTDEEAFSPVHSIRAVEGFWYSPSIPIEPFKTYAVTFHAHSNQEGFAGVLSNIDFLYEGSATWNLNPFLFRGEVDESATNVLFRPPGTGAAYFDDVTVEEVDGEDAALVLDQMFQEMEMPLYTFSAASGRHAHLTSAIEKLENGEVLRIVMLGDSIVKDISHSYFEALVERLYPGASVEIVTSVLGSTGCWWYREVEPETGVPRVETYVTDYNPDLVMIGGISHGDQGLDYEIESISDVIQQILANDPDTEFILMTEAAGANDPYKSEEILLDVDPLANDWRGKLYQLAKYENVEYLDLTSPWADYILHSGRPYQWYLRDAIHMNARGSQLVGRIVEAYFAPGTPDADGDGIADPLDPCPGDPQNDVDHDLLCSNVDPDDDGDSVPDGLDCAPQSHLAWEPPGEVAPCDSPGACLLLSGPAEATELTWQAPDGGTLFWYDTLRTTTTADFVTNLVCVEAGDASDTESGDEALPAPGELWSYLVHARNACGTGIAGRNSSGEAIETIGCA